MPGAARFLEWCYAQEVDLIHRGGFFKKSSRGQQGCPLMGPAFCAMKKEMRDMIPEARGLDFSADYADDGVMGGGASEVFKVLEKEIALGRENGLRNNFEKWLCTPLQGVGSQGTCRSLSSWVSKSIIQAMLSSCRFRLWGMPRFWRNGQSRSWK